MRFSKNKQLHIERCITAIQKKKTIQYKVIAEKTKICDMIKSASHATKNLLELFYTQSSIAYALSGLKYHDLKKKKRKKQKTQVRIKTSILK